MSVYLMVQSAVENQLRQVKAGRDLTSLERIPNPVVPVPPQLGMMMMRPGFYPLMPLSRAPFGMGGMMDPNLLMNKPRPAGPVGAMPVSVVSLLSCGSVCSFLFQYLFS